MKLSTWALSQTQFNPVQSSSIQVQSKFNPSSIQFNPVQSSSIQYKTPTPQKQKHVSFPLQGFTIEKYVLPEPWSLKSSQIYFLDFHCCFSCTPLYDLSNLETKSIWKRSRTRLCEVFQWIQNKTTKTKEKQNAIVSPFIVAKTHKRKNAKNWKKTR